MAAAVATATDARVRGAALGALVRNGTQVQARRAWTTAVRDTDPAVRRRAAELAPKLPAPAARPLITMLKDRDALVAESAAFGCGEILWDEQRRSRIVEGLTTATRHDNALVREAAVAALGSLGDPAGLSAILVACTDQPPVRRRAVLALAPFDGPAVDAALVAALGDSDWQTRQAAEDLGALDITAE